jgi:hypothetical protein
MTAVRGGYVAGALVLVAWLLDWVGMYIGAAKPNHAVLIVAGLLLFGVWRGVRWCRALILWLARAVGALVLCIGITALFGAHGVVISQLIGLTFFVVSGVLLAAKPVPHLVP